jgi:serine/threonine protein kinase
MGRKPFSGSSGTLLAPDTIVEGYQIEEALGAGAMSIVYRAIQLTLGRVVALKVLAPELGGDENFRLRFQREGRLQARMDHPHVVTVYEAGQSDYGLFLAMCLIQGPTLKELIVARELEPRLTVQLLRGVADALDAAHAVGLIHRDVKPQNILIGARNHVYLADFGLTRAADDETLTVDGQFMGTVDYVAPEQVQGDEVTAAADVYGLAAVLFECLTGSVPFPRETEAATAFAHLTEPPPRVSELRPDLPVALDEVIAAGMAKDPLRRPRAANDLLRAASEALARDEPGVLAVGA